MCDVRPSTSRASSRAAVKLVGPAVRDSPDSHPARRQRAANRHDRRERHPGTTRRRARTLSRMRCVVLTGVSRGLGAALFAELAGRGDRIFAIGRHFADEQRTLAAAEPDRITLHEADLADPGTLPDAGTLHDFLSSG